MLKTLLKSVREYRRFRAGVRKEVDKKGYSI